VLGKPQHVDGAVHARFGSLDGVMLIVHRGCRAGQVIDLIDLDIERERHVMPDKLEVLVIEQMLDVAAGAGEKIVEADDIGAVVEQALAQMRAQKACATGDQNSCFEMHGHSIT
jgi:hypothetical protein